MVDADKRAFKEMVNVLALNFSRSTSDPLYRLLWAGLKDLPMASVRKGFDRAIKLCQFFPPVAKLRTLAGHGEASQLEYYQPFDPGKALPAWETTKAEVGGFRKYLHELAEEKSVKGGKSR